jgi:hypothetical protein
MADGLPLERHSGPNTKNMAIASIDDRLGALTAPRMW